MAFFVKLTLWQEEKDFQDLFSAFETQDNIQIEYICIGYYANVSKKTYKKMLH